MKLLHDLHNDSAALSSLGGVELRGCLDSQLAMEALCGKLHMGFDDMLQQVGQERHPSKFAMKLRMDRARVGQGGSIFAQRPLPRDVIEYAAWDASLLLAAHTRLVELLGDRLPKLRQASDARARHAAKSGGAARLCGLDQPICAGLSGAH